MRLASFLPMLLLAFSIPVAAQNCNISDLTAQVVQVNPLNCTFFVALEFQHSGPGNQCTVTGNGTNYGMFPYGQLPIVLGPFNGNPNNPTVLEFVVQDVLFPDCHDAVVVDFPPCGNGGCDISNLAVVPGPCAPGGQSYALFVNFDVSVILSGNSFNVWANGALIGNFPLVNLPLLIPNFPASGNPKDVIKICIDGHPDCCETLEFDAPDCAIAPCGITNLKVETGPCLSDSTYKVVINFDAIGPAVGDSFTLRANNHVLGVFGINQLPLMQVIKWDGGLHDIIKVCVTDAAGTICCVEKEYAVPDCLPLIPCGIHNLVAKSDTCTSDSTFLAVLNFEVNDPTAVDSFELWANGQYWGKFGLNQLPLHIPDFPWNGLIFSHIRVCTGNTPACCKEYQFLAPPCLPYDPCELTDIFLQTGPCTSDSTYKITINFNATNPGNGTFTLSIHNQLVDTFDLHQLPLTVEVPWNGQATDFINICILEGNPNSPDGCCRIKQFTVPSCILPCNIFDVSLDPGDCVPGTNAFNLHLNFSVQNPGNGFFEVWGNGDYLGVFPLAGLPMVIPNFPSNGADPDVIKICINDQPDCCKILDFQGPDCNQAPCEIFDVNIDPGDCDPATGNYNLHLNFSVQNANNALFEVWGNGTYLGAFPLAGLPMIIPNFPSNGNALDVIKICIVDQPDCCKTIDFQGPSCDGPCEIFDLSVLVGDCHPADSTYTVKVDFQVQNPGSNTFTLWANGQIFGTYNLNQLPLVIPNFPWDGNGPNDIIKVCITNANGALSCCKTIEYPSPDCFPHNNCDINDLHVQVGGCTSNSTYEIVVNFNVVNPPSNVFSLWANGQFFGTYNLNQLPLGIPNFPWDGGQTDYIKVCFSNTPGGPADCCAEADFNVPDCLFGAPCEIYDLTVTPGDCDPNSQTYPLTFNFQVDNPGNDFFEVWVNGIYYGSHLLSALPVTLPSIPTNGNAFDIIKVCINDHPDCCRTLEFPGPSCGGNTDCEIFDVVLDPGDCNPATNTYNLHLNFQVHNPGNDFFEVWGNGVYLGLFPLNALPIVIPNFPANGPAVDIIKICINDNPDCCKVIDFQGPNCGGGNCEIFNLAVETGDCTSDSTYNLKLNFQFINAPSDIFGVWANGGQFLGNFNVNQLPLFFPDFPWDGGAFDGVKVGFQPNVPGTDLCCASLEFHVPDCLNDACHIYDLKVLHTPCLCGQFFAVLSFQFSGGVSGSFDIMGNGNNYGNFPYNTPQPIILGPFNGDGTTSYNFVVKDHEHPNDCNDEFNLGKVECMIPVNDPGNSSMLTLSPNPTSNWLNVTATLENGAVMGQSNVELYAADGRLVQTSTVANGANFQLDVSNLPSGVYRIVLLNDSGRLEAKFVKQ